MTFFVHIPEDGWWSDEFQAIYSASGRDVGFRD
jgi:hypothetical protein